MARLFEKRYGTPCTLEHDFRFLDLYVIVELFCALCNETSAREVNARARSTNTVSRGRLKYFLLHEYTRTNFFSQILIRARNIYADFSRTILFHADLNGYFDNWNCL